jgi:hypothetical protein
MRIIYSFDDDLESADEILLNPGESFHVPIGLRELDEIDS